MGILLYGLATAVKPSIQDKIKFITRYIAEDKLNTEFKVHSKFIYYKSGTLFKQNNKKHPIY